MKISLLKLVYCFGTMVQMFNRPLTLFLISILAVYTSNGRQRTAEEDLRDFLGKGTSEADRINSPLSRLWLYTTYRVT